MQSLVKTNLCRVTKGATLNIGCTALSKGRLKQNTCFDPNGTLDEIEKTLLPHLPLREKGISQKLEAVYFADWQNLSSLLTFHPKMHNFT